MEPYNESAKTILKIPLPSGFNLDSIDNQPISKKVLPKIAPSKLKV